MDKVVGYVKDSIEEIKRVQWPTKQETVKLTGFVIAVSVGVGLFISMFDYIFTELLSLLIK